MHHIDKKDLEELREFLESEGADIEMQLEEHGKKGEDGIWEGSSESIGEEPDHTDAADNIEELATNVPLVKELSDRLRDITDALAKMDTKTYGICEVGKEEISLDRLMVNPAARTCITHATQ